MSAPTNVRVEAHGLGENVLNWDYPGSNSIGVYRSLANSSYALISSPLVDSDTLTFSDTNAEDAVQYFYKLSDNGGSTFSAVVSVVSVTNCVGISNTPGLIERAIDVVTPEMFNEVVNHLEAQDNQDQLNPPCIICSLDGAIILNCLENCNHFQIIMTEDVNSVSYIGCDGCVNIDCIIPPGVTRHICGWPPGCGFGGDECQNDIIGPKTFHSQTGVTTPIGPTSTSTQDDCKCQAPITIEPYIQCCSDPDGTHPELCEFSCSANNKIKYKVCGGFEPYTWESSNNVKLTKVKGSKGNNKVTAALSQPNNPANGAAFAQIGVKAEGNIDPFAEGGSCVGGGPSSGGVFVQYLDCNGKLLSGLNYPYDTFGGHSHCGRPRDCTPGEFCHSTTPYACGAVTITEYRENTTPQPGCTVDPYCDSVTITAKALNGNVMTTNVSGWIGQSTPLDCYPCGAFPCTQCEGQDLRNSCTGAAYRQCKCFLSGSTLDLRTPEQVAAGCAEPCPEGDDGTITVTDAFGNSATILVPINP